MQPISGSIIGSLLFDCFPNIIKVFIRISAITDHNIIRNVLGGICKAGFFLCAIVDVANPTVRLDTNGDINRGHFQGAADVADFIIVGIIGP